MTDPRGFLQIARRVAPYRPARERRRDWRDVNGAIEPALAEEQARRCMDCGVPFCHTGCPLGNLIPDWNDLVERGRWREASDRLYATNNFPEFTGKLCPAPCEEACVLALNDDPVTIKQVEMAIAERSIDEGWTIPLPPATESGRRVAVVGSGPAGLAAAQQLRRAGHAVDVYERDDRPGGLLRYGIPDFKLAKALVDARVAQLEAEGVRFLCNELVDDLDALRAAADAVVIATGAQRHRDLEIEGRELAGIGFAMPYLVARQCRRTPRRHPRRRRHERGLPRLGASRGLRLGRGGGARRRAADRAITARDVARVAAPEAIVCGARRGRRPDLHLRDRGVRRRRRARDRAPRH
jgi:glutamate synthase (NADPH) small chain